MSTIEQFIALYDLQGVHFQDWMSSYWEAGYYLEQIRITVGNKNVLAWLKSNCPAVDIEFCKDLLEKLDRTQSGGIIRTQVARGLEFTLPR